ncbi:MAG: class II aldolase/adducin family protein [Actinobacteria bacterium]|nr:class II aldolase/adducin family protein [Actinomycetota bacterium]
MNEAEQRRHLAAAFRWTARLGLHEGVANHFSALLPGSDTQFLLNARGAHFSRITASSLLSLDASTAGGAAHPDADPTAWFLHAHLHRLVPHARVILHTHMPYATSLACLDGFELQMLDQSSCRFFRRVAYDRHFSGMFLDDREGPRLAAMLADGVSTVFLGNHGVMVVGQTVAEAFDELYYLERVAQLHVYALSTGRPLQLIPDDIAELTCRQWLEYPEGPDLHFRALLEILDEEEPGYRD